MNYITGSGGFLGSHLLKRVINPNCIPHQFIPLVKLEPFESFYFLSSYGNMSFHNDDNEIIKANITDLIKILSQASKFNFKSFVYISTSSVKLRTQTMYSRCKRAAEEILLSYMEKYSLPICIIRPFSITGVGEQQGHLIPTLIRSCMTGELVNFVPHPTHDFIDVDDLIDGVLNLSSHSARGIFELGTGTRYSNQEVLKLVEEITGKKANINNITSLRDYDNLNWVSTNFKARSFGWLPKKDLRKSISEMVKDYKRSREKNN